jgi:hypothetical protein
MKTGERVRLVTPGNDRLRGQFARVAEVTAWGAHVTTAAAATGNFRAHHSEMQTPDLLPSGDICDRCGSPNVVRAGTCKLCRDCGSTDGGCS